MTAYFVVTEQHEDFNPDDQPFYRDEPIAVIVNDEATADTIAQRVRGGKVYKVTNDWLIPPGL